MLLDVKFFINSVERWSRTAARLKRLQENPRKEVLPGRFSIDSDNKVIISTFFVNQTPSITYRVTAECRSVGSIAGQVRFGIQNNAIKSGRFVPSKIN